MKKSLLLLLVLLLAGCSSTWHVSTTGHDPIYSIEGSDAEIVVINNEFELQRLLRTDINFRFDFAQYALSQPTSFDWNNRILGNRYNRYNPYWGYGSYWNRDQMWNDWVWGFTPHRWSPFGYDRWGYNNWGYAWNNYGWNNYGWNNWNYYTNYNRAWNTTNTYGRRGINSNISGRVVSRNIERTQTVDDIADLIKVEVKNRRINNTRNDKTINTNTRRQVRTQSSDNGRRSRIRENVSTQPVRLGQSSSIQPRQVYRRQNPPVLQQTRTSSQSNVQRRNGSSRRKN